MVAEPWLIMVLMVPLLRPVIMEFMGPARFQMVIMAAISMVIYIPPEPTPRAAAVSLSIIPWTPKTAIWFIVMSNHPT